MKSVFTILIFLCAGFSAFSQKDYFVYIQSDNRQPFYVSMDGKTRSSSEGGYIILSNLKAQAYQFAVGFPKNAFPEQTFVVNINNKDAGFQLKNFLEKGWGLFNMQTLDVVMNRNNEAANPIATTVTGEKKTDAFSSLLSNVVNDSSILYQNKPEPKTVAVTQTAPEQAKPENVTQANTTPVTIVTTPPVEEAKKELATAPVVADTASAIVESAAATENAAATKRSLSAIKKITETTTPFAFVQEYVVTSEEGIDTVYVSIPLMQESVVVEESKPAVAVVPETPAPKVETQPEVKQQPELVEQKPEEQEKHNQVRIDNSDCKNLASESDIDKLRVKLVSQEDLNDKIATTKKLLKSRCFTVKQLRAISELFSNDESKYRLLEAAYPFTLDTYNFYTLEDLMQTQYYQNQFKAMIKR